MLPLFATLTVKVTGSPARGSLRDQSRLWIRRSASRGERMTVFLLLVSSLSSTILLESTKALIVCSRLVMVQVKV